MVIIWTIEVYFLLLLQSACNLIRRWFKICYFILLHEGLQMKLHLNEFSYAPLPSNRKSYLYRLWILIHCCRMPISYVFLLIIRIVQSVSINEFLKPADGEKHYNTGRGRGRGRGGPRGGYGGSFESSNARAPAIEDPGQFPTLGGKWWAWDEHRTGLSRGITGIMLYVLKRSWKSLMLKDVYLIYVSLLSL